MSRTVYTPIDEGERTGASNASSPSWLRQMSVVTSEDCPSLLLAARLKRYLWASNPQLTSDSIR